MFSLRRIAWCIQARVARNVRRVAGKKPVSALDGRAGHVIGFAHVDQAGQNQQAEFLQRCR